MNTARPGAKKIGLMILVAFCLGYATFALQSYLSRPKPKKQRKPIQNQNSKQPVWTRSNPSGQKNKPIPADLTVPADEDPAFLETVLQTIFPQGRKQLSDEEKTLEILRYVASYLKDKTTSKSRATDILRDGFSFCGGKGQVFVILARKVGIPARIVNGVYLPTLSSHVATEVFYAGNWHFIDPTFGIFFYSRPEYDQQGTIISFQELVLDASFGTPFKVVKEPWKGEYTNRIRSFGVAHIEPDFLEYKYGSSFISLYRQELAGAYPIFSGDSSFVSYPVDADFEKQDAFFLGEINQSGDDLVRFRAKNSAEYGTRYFGNWAIGQGAPAMCHTWLIHSPPQSLIQIEYYGLQPSPPKLKLFPLRTAHLVETRYEGTKTTFLVRVIDHDAIVSVNCPKGVFEIDAMKAARIGLKNSG